MSQYTVEWTQEVWYRATLEADSEQQVQERFFAGTLPNGKVIGAEIQDSIQITKVE